MSLKLLVFMLYLAFSLISLLLASGLFFLNIQLGFFTSLGIFLSSFKTYKSLLRNDTILADHDIIQSEINNKTLLKEGLSYIGYFFSLSRLLAYLVLVSAFLLLYNFELLDPIAFIIGISLSLGLNLIYIFVRKD